MNPLFLAIMASARGTGIDKGVWKGKNTSVALPPIYNCTAVAMSANGAYMYAAYSNSGNANGYLYRSTDSGVTWSLMVTTFKQINHMRCSDSGQYLVMAGYSGYIASSTNYGVSTVEAAAASLGLSWQSVAISTDGSQMTVCHGTLDVDGWYTYNPQYYSTDSGATWQNYSLAAFADEKFTAVYITSSGKFTVSTLGRMYRDGVGQGISSLRVSAYGGSVAVRGSKVLAASGITNSYLQVSSNYGSQGTFSDLTSLPQKQYTTVSVSQDGNKIVAGTYSSELVISMDGGATWATDTTFVGSGTQMNTPSVLANGSKILIANGYAYGNF